MIQGNSSGPRQGVYTPLLLLLRLVVTGVGVAFLTGTLLHRYRPATGNAVTFSCLPC